MAGNQIILLPRVDYFKWVNAVKNYALHYGVGITPDPMKLNYKDVATLVIPPDGYPHEGDIEEYVQRHFPHLELDPLYVDSPEEVLAILADRVAKRQRYGELSAKKSSTDVLPRFPTNRLYLFWPTDYETMLQSFGANPNIYLQFGLPGHEGVDFRAPYNSNVYACADGEVYMVEDGSQKHNYGRHIRIRHSAGYRTVYAHLERALVEVGERVKARQLIGRADSTGNSTGSHLHLTLKKDGATKRGETNYPNDIIDPTPFLVFPHLEDEVMEALGMKRDPDRMQNYPWARPCLVGLNARQSGSMQELDFEIVSKARLEAVKIYRFTSTQTIQRLRAISPKMFLLAQIFHLPQTETLTSSGWLDAVRQDIERLYEENVRYFEIQRSPNLQLYGWNRLWNSGREFGAWWLDVYGILHKDFPDARFGFPGIMPGGQVSGQRMDANVFLDGADEAMLEADWIGVNCYWANEAEMNQREWGQFYKFMRERFPDKLLFVAEFGNINMQTNPEVKGREYVDFYARLREIPGIGAAFAQVSSAARGYDWLVWRNEEGRMNAIPGVVGKREF